MVQTIKDSPNLCEPGDTIINYMFPTVEGVCIFYLHPCDWCIHRTVESDIPTAFVAAGKDYTFDGNGELVSDIDGALVLMYQRDLVFYMDRYVVVIGTRDTICWFVDAIQGS